MKRKGYGRDRGLTLRMFSTSSCWGCSTSRSPSVLFYRS